MQTITVNLYSFSELSDDAKQNAIEKIRYPYELAWSDESLDSIKTFCNYFNVKLKSYEVDSCTFDYSHDATNENFRGIKLSSINRDHMPTGYCLDCDLWMTFYDEFKRTGSALKAFNDALYAGFKAWRNDIEWQLSDEHLSEYAEANEYQFTENGSIY